MLTEILTLTAVAISFGLILFAWPEMRHRSRAEVKKNPELPFRMFILVLIFSMGMDSFQSLTAGGEELDGIFRIMSFATSSALILSAIACLYTGVFRFGESTDLSPKLNQGER